MSRTVVQIPVEKSLRDDAYNMAVSQGFSSLQEAMRVIMHKFVKGTLAVDVYVEPTPIQLSTKAIARYEQMEKDFENGVNTYTTNNNDFLSDLKKRVNEN